MPKSYATRVATSVLLLAALAVPCAAVGVHAHLKAKNKVLAHKQPVTDEAHAPVLMGFLKELKAEAQVGLKRAKLVSHWCHTARIQKAGMASVLQRQLHEAALAIRQVEVEEKRLASEARLANATRAQKIQQLQDAAATGSFANGEFKNEQTEMQRTIDAASHAMTLIEMEGVSADPASSGGNSEEVSVDALLGDPQASGSDDSPRLRAQQLKLKLKHMYAQLTQEKGSASLEHNSMLEKLWSFTDHLNSSIMEAQSQVAAITMETAQRKREHARLSGRIEGLASLLRAVNASSKATDVTCLEEEKHRGDIASFITAESNAVTAIMSHLPSNSGELLQQESRPAAFLQVATESTGMLVRKALDNVQELAHQFPEESDWYTSALTHLATLHRATTAAPAAATAASGEAQEDAASSDAEDNGRDVMKGISQFVTDPSMADASAGVAATEGAAGFAAKQLPDADEVRSLFAGLLGKVHAKAHAVTEQQGECASVLQHAAVDDAALQRSLKRVTAKLHIAEATMAEYTRMIEFDETQRKLVAASSQELVVVSGEASKEGATSLEALRESSQRLVSLATDMIQTQDNDAAWVKDLLRKVEEHQAVLQRRSQRFSAQTAAVEAADKVLLRVLDEDAKQNRRSFSKAQAEFKLLKGRTQAKADNQELSGHFQQAALALCSDKRMQQLKDKAAELEEEGKALKRNMPKQLQEEV